MLPHSARGLIISQRDDKPKVIYLCWIEIWPNARAFLAFVQLWKNWHLKNKRDLCQESNRIVMVSGWLVGKSLLWIPGNMPACWQYSCRKLLVSHTNGSYIIHKEHGFHLKPLTKGHETAWYDVPLICRCHPHFHAPISDFAQGCTTCWTQPTQPSLLPFVYCCIWNQHWWGWCCTYVKQTLSLSFSPKAVAGSLRLNAMTCLSHVLAVKPHCWLWALFILMLIGSGTGALITQSLSCY